MLMSIKHFCMSHFVYSSTECVKYVVVDLCQVLDLLSPDLCMY